MTNPIAGRWYPIEDKAMWPKDHFRPILMMGNDFQEIKTTGKILSALHPKSKMTHFFIIPTLQEQEERTRMAVGMIGYLHSLGFDDKHHLGLGDVRITQGTIEEISSLLRQL